MTCNMTRQDSLRPLLEGQRQQHDRGICSSGLGSIFGEIGDVPSLCAEQSRSQCELLAQSTRFCNGCPGILTSLVFVAPGGCVQQAQEFVLGAGSPDQRRASRVP
jgi:hypothetical protein